MLLFFGKLLELHSGVHSWHQLTSLGNIVAVYFQRSEVSYTGHLSRKNDKSCQIIMKIV